MHFCLTEQVLLYRPATVQQKTDIMNFPPVDLILLSPSSSRVAPRAGQTSGDALCQQHGGGPDGAQLLHSCPLLHPQQPDQCGLWQRVRQHRRREDLLHLHHAHRRYVWHKGAFSLWRPGSVSWEYSRKWAGRLGWFSWSSLSPSLYTNNQIMFA